MESPCRGGVLQACEIAPEPGRHVGTTRGQGLPGTVKHGKAWLQIVGGIGREPELASVPLPALGETAAVKLRVILPGECLSHGQSNNHHSNKGPQGVSAKLKRADSGR